MTTIITDINATVRITRKWAMAIIGTALASKLTKVRPRSTIVVGIAVSTNNKIFLLTSKSSRPVWADFKVS